MKERPIIFSGPMVRAILDERKTMTRRVVNPQPRRDAERPYVRGTLCPAHTCPYGVPGDRLYVRETFAGCKGFPLGQRKLFYRADGEVTGRQESLSYYEREDRWRPSIHMPKWATRIWLEVTDVRVERVQDISENDAVAEGAFFTDYGRNCGHQGGGWQDVGNCPRPDAHHPQRNGWAMRPTTGPDQCLSTARWAFANLWQKLNAKRAPWDSNPWVWVISFQQPRP